MNNLQNIYSGPCHMVSLLTTRPKTSIQPFQLPWLDTARMNPYSKIGPEVAFLCVKDDKGHSLMQTSFAELPNSKQTPRWCICVSVLWVPALILVWRAGDQVRHLLKNKCKNYFHLFYVRTFTLECRAKLAWKSIPSRSKIRDKHKIQNIKFIMTRDEVKFYNDN